MIENRYDTYAPWIAKNRQSESKRAFYQLDRVHSLSGGPCPIGYDIHNRDRAILREGHMVKLWTHEEVDIPHNVAVSVTTKSTLAGLGVHLNTTMIDPGFRGCVMLEAALQPPWNGLLAHWAGIIRPRTLNIPKGAPIGTLIFHYTAGMADYGDAGLYQDQTADDERR